MEAHSAVSRPRLDSLEHGGRLDGHGPEELRLATPSAAKRSRGRCDASTASGRLIATPSASAVARRAGRHIPAAGRALRPGGHPWAGFAVSARMRSAWRRGIAISDFGRRIAAEQRSRPAHIRNPNTRRAYARACGRFFAWCDGRGLTLTTIRPFDVATYIETLGKTHSAPGVKRQLAAVRMLFDWLITGQVAPSNPASAVRGPTHVVKTGTTPVLEGKSGGG
jgi:Phage integrase, N-terminal SAM-like domain